MCRGSVLAFTEALQSEPAAEQGRCYMEDIMLGASANDSTSNRPVVLTSHIMKMLEGLILWVLIPQLRHTLDPL